MGIERAARSCQPPDEGVVAIALPRGIARERTAWARVGGRMPRAGVGEDDDLATVKLHQRGAARAISHQVMERWAALPVNVVLPQDRNRFIGAARTVEDRGESPPASRWRVCRNHAARRRRERRPCPPRRPPHSCCRMARMAHRAGCGARSTGASSGQPCGHRSRDTRCPP